MAEAKKRLGALTPEQVEARRVKVEAAKKMQAEILRNSFERAAAKLREATNASSEPASSDVGGAG